MKIIVEFQFPEHLYDNVPDDILLANLDKSFPVSGVSHRVIKRISSAKVTFDSLEKEVCSYVGCSPEDLQNPLRKGDGKIARQLCHHIARNLHLGSLESIGARYGKKDHATVLHSNRTILNLLETDKVFRSQYEHFIDSFNKHKNAKA